MPLILDPHESLPYIDIQPSAEDLAAATSLVTAELSPEQKTTVHPSLPPAYTPSFPSLIEDMHVRLEAKQPLRSPQEGIDLTRYEEPEAPTSSLDSGSWHQVLRKAYTSSSYLSQRAINLSLLERYGKNVWLIANSQVEDDLRAVERELIEVKAQLEDIERERREVQEGIRGEVEGLEETWRDMVGRAIEAEVATERLRREILDRRRAAGGS